MPLFRIVKGVVSGGETFIKPGDIVDWTAEQAAEWYPNLPGAIEPVPDERQEVVTEHAEEKPEVEPEPSEIKPRAAGEDPAERAPYEEVTPEPEKAEVTYRKAKNRRGR
jgi:hypothetical protein